MSSALEHEIPELLEAGEVLSWIREVSGTDLVFPGHPVVIACAIIALYGALPSVIAGTENGSIEALADSRIPGTSDCVRCAVHALKSGRSVSEMLDEMRRYWSRSQAGGHMGNVDPGIAQALKLEPYFRENVEPWLALSSKPQYSGSEQGGRNE